MAAPPRATKSTVEGTIVFTDIVGFTEFTALRGDDEALELLSRQDHLVDDALPKGARIVKELGDGLLLWFPEAVGALRTAFVLQRRFEEESVATGAPLWVRMGLHHGQARRRGDDLIGHDVNVAARIVGVAGPGEVLVSEAARACVGLELPGVCFDELGPVVMKGIPEPVRLWRASPS
jgi:adenylate cyclase